MPPGGELWWEYTRGDGRRETSSSGDRRDRGPGRRRRAPASAKSGRRSPGTRSTDHGDRHRKRKRAAAGGRRSDHEGRRGANCARLAGAGGIGRLMRHPDRLPDEDDGRPKGNTRAAEGPALRPDGDDRPGPEKICPLPAHGRATSRMKNIKQERKWNKQSAGRGQPAGGRKAVRTGERGPRCPPRRNGGPGTRAKRGRAPVSCRWSARSGRRTRASGRERAGGSDRAPSAP